MFVGALPDPRFDGGSGIQPLVVIGGESAVQGPEDAFDPIPRRIDGTDDDRFDVGRSPEHQPVPHLRIPFVQGQSGHGDYDRGP